MDIVDSYVSKNQKQIDFPVHIGDTFKCVCTLSGSRQRSNTGL